MQFDPLGSVIGLTGCFVDWILTRPWRLVILFFLPMVFACTVGGLVIAGSWLNRDVLADRYLRMADAEVAKWEAKWAPVDPANDQEKSGTTASLDPVQPRTTFPVRRKCSSDESSSYSRTIAEACSLWR